MWSSSHVQRQPQDFRIKARNKGSMPEIKKSLLFDEKDVNKMSNRKKRSRNVIS